MPREEGTADSLARTAIKFLTATGQICTDLRQEFILLSDVLGVSALVDVVNHPKPKGATESTVLGPFFVEETREVSLLSSPTHATASPTDTRRSRTATRSHQRARAHTCSSRAA
jgi:hypothetical protein